MGDALGAIGRSFAPLFREYGHELVEVNFARPGAIDMLNAELQRGSVEFALTFMGMASDLARQERRWALGKSVWMATGIPLISAFRRYTQGYFFDRHVMPTPFCASLYAFPEHAATCAGHSRSFEAFWACRLRVQWRLSRKALSIFARRNRAGYCFSRMVTILRS